MEDKLMLGLFVICLIVILILQANRWRLNPKYLCTSGAKLNLSDLFHMKIIKVGGGWNLHYDYDNDNEGSYRAQWFETRIEVIDEIKNMKKFKLKYLSRNEIDKEFQKLFMEVDTANEN